jgi:hypothetical protein
MSRAREHEAAAKVFCLLAKLSSAHPSLAVMAQFTRPQPWPVLSDRRYFVSARSRLLVSGQSPIEQIPTTFAASVHASFSILTWLLFRLALVWRDLCPILARCALYANHRKVVGLTRQFSKHRQLDAECLCAPTPMRLQGRMLAAPERGPESDDTNDFTSLKSSLE